MDEQTVRRIFEPFFSTKKEKGGTGLGLAVVYGIVSQHGGWIDVDSAPGAGTSFKVFIPAVLVEAGDEEGRQEPAAELRGRGERVLLVEDEEAVRALANRMLSENGYEVYAAAGAEEATKIFEREHGEFDIVFCDVVLPGEDGVELVERLKRRRPSLKVLFASGYGGGETNRAVIEQKGYAFMQKPYSLTSLMRALRDVLSDGGRGTVSGRVQGR